jgi:hypothetical protein
MLLLATLHIKHNKIKLKNTQRIYLQSALFSLEFWAKIIWVLIILRVENIGIRIKKQNVITGKSALFSPKSWCKIVEVVSGYFAC